MESRVKPEPFPGLIATCRFPYESDTTKPGPDIRPVLVTEILRSGKVICAYGSAAKANGTGLTPIESHQIEVEPDKVSGLAENTRFDFLKRFPLDWTNTWFVYMEDNQTVRVGTLNQVQKTAASAAKNVADALIASDPRKKWPKPKATPIIVTRKKYSVPPLKQDGEGDTSAP